MPDLLEQEWSVNTESPDLMAALKQARLNAEGIALDWGELLRADAGRYWAPLAGLYFPAALAAFEWPTEYPNVAALFYGFVVGEDKNEAVRLIVTQGIFAETSSSATLASQQAAIAAMPTDDKPTADEFLNWLESEDFGDDPTRLRREAWGQ